MISDVIRALTIFLKYADEDNHYPYYIQCESDTLFVHIHPNCVSVEDISELSSFGFYIDNSGTCFVSIEHGSC